MLDHAIPITRYYCLGMLDIRTPDKGAGNGDKAHRIDLHLLIAIRELLGTIAGYG